MINYLLKIVLNFYLYGNIKAYTYECILHVCRHVCMYIHTSFLSHSCVYNYIKHLTYVCAYIYKHTFTFSIIFSVLFNCNKNTLDYNKITFIIYERTVQIFLYIIEQVIFFHSVLLSLTFTDSLLSLSSCSLSSSSSLFSEPSEESNHVCDDKSSAINIFHSSSLRQSI